MVKPTNNHAPTVGETLRKAREQKRISIEEAAKETHIPLAQIEGLEQENFTVFSATVYATGALRVYARYLGIEVTMIERNLMMAMREQSRPKPPRLALFATWYERFISANTVVAGGALFAVAVVGAYVVWHVNSFWRLPHLKISEPTNQVVDAPEALIRGSTEPDVKVQINGEPVMLGQDYVFEQAIPLTKGVTIVRIEATGPSGRVAVVEKHLLRPRNTR